MPKRYLFVIFIDGLKNSLQIIHIVVLEMVEAASGNFHSLLNRQIHALIPIKMLLNRLLILQMYATIMSPRLLKAGMTLLRAAKPWAYTIALSVPSTRVSSFSSLR